MKVGRGSLSVVKKCEIADTEEEGNLNEILYTSRHQYGTR